MVFCCGCDVKLVDGMVIPWIINLRAVTALVSMLRFKVDRVRHAKWEDPEEEQGPNRDVTECPISRVKYTSNTVWPPVGDIVFPYLSPKFAQGCWGSPLCGCVSRR
jgi:hypothetical protein